MYILRRITFVVLLGILWTIESFRCNRQTRKDHSILQFDLANRLNRPISGCPHSKFSYLKLREDDGDESPKLSLNDDFPKRFKVKDLEEEEKERVAAARRGDKSEYLSTKSQTARTVSTGATFGSVTIEELKGRIAANDAKRSNLGRKALPKKEEDLNGIDPLKPLLFSAVAAAMSFVGWQLTIYMTGHFAVDFLDSEIYPLQRFAIVARNVIVGITTLGASFSAIISVGLILLSVRVGLGVAKGELDPNKLTDSLKDVTE